MINWILGGLIVVLAAAAIFKIRRDRKSGRTCGGNCSGCMGSAACKKQRDQTD